MLARGIIGVVLGAVTGYGFHRFVGCRSGACAIWSNPRIATAYGALLGFLLAQDG